jgi:YhcH/YjgK/YiaL family protein
MILDALQHVGRYASLHPGFGRAFEFLRRTDLASLPSGRHPIDGERLFASLDRTTGRGRDRARLEVHRRYIDVQFTIDGNEEIGWLPLGACARPASPFDENKDVGFFEDRPRSWLHLPPGCFAIFFPEDAHAPLAASGELSKAIVKIAVDLPFNLPSA